MCAHLEFTSCTLTQKRRRLWRSSPEGGASSPARPTRSCHQGSWNLSVFAASCFDVFSGISEESHVIRAASRCLGVWLLPCDRAPGPIEVVMSYFFE